MKLTDLNPRWLSDGEARHGMAISFDCPHCRGQKLAVWFANPIDGLAPNPTQKLWQRQGESFDSLTLTPSVDASESGHWHGFIFNGEIQ